MAERQHQLALLDVGEGLADLLHAHAQLALVVVPGREQGRVEADEAHREAARRDEVVDPVQPAVGVGADRREGPANSR